MEEEKELCSITVSEAISEDDEDDNNVISSVLKTGSSRPEEISKKTRKVFEADNNAPNPAEANPATEADEAALPTKDANQP